MTVSRQPFRRVATLLVSTLAALSPIVFQPAVASAATQVNHVHLRGEVAIGEAWMEDGCENTYASVWAEEKTQSVVAYVYRFNTCDGTWADGLSHTSAHVDINSKLTSARVVTSVDLYDFSSETPTSVPLDLTLTGTSSLRPVNSTDASYRAPGEYQFVYVSSGRQRQAAINDAAWTGSGTIGSVNNAYVAVTKY